MLALQYFTQLQRVVNMGGKYEDLYLLLVQTPVYVIIHTTTVVRTAYKLLLNPLYLVTALN